MSLAPGERLGPYEILSSIGAGGMGEVYKARDTRLGRIVAIKTSQARFSERFEREARAVAALSHPHICTLYDVGADYLVMEYIDGKPLHGPMPVDVAVRYAGQIGSALQAAHRLNIIHRDLKPGNILVTKAGIKLLDFGLAKMNAPISGPGSDETATKALTEEGAIVGTLHYMSPEQLEGKEADARSDIFSFGCVLYEMLTGRAAFQGDSKASIIAAIMDREPEPLDGVPPALAGAIGTCMAKDPDDRWQSAGDLSGVLELAAVAPQAAKAPARRTATLAMVLGLVALLSAAAAIWFATRKPVETRWSGIRLGGPPGAMGPRVSPDGHTIAFQAMIDGQTQVAVLTPETGNWTVLTHQKDLGQVNDIAWSRDGSKLYFDRSTDAPKAVYSVPVLGGEPRMVLELAGSPQVLSDGSLAVVRINSHRDSQIYRFWPETGKVQVLPAVVDTRLTVGGARAMPDGKNLIFYGFRSNHGGDRLEPGLFAMDIDGGHMHHLAPGVALPTPSMGNTIQVERAFAGTPDGRWVVMSAPNGSLYRLIEVPFDGGDEVHTLVTPTLVPWYIDVGPLGDIYSDQIWIGKTLLRFGAAGGEPERLTGMYSQSVATLAVLHDGRPLVMSQAGDRQRVAIVEKDGTLTPLVETNEACGPPATLLGDRNVALMTDHKGEIAVVSVADGRIVSRLRLPADNVISLSGSPDGRTLYYVSAGFVWRIPAAGGDVVKLAPADSVAADPNGRDLVIGLGDKESIRLMRMPVDGGTPQEIGMTGDLRLGEPNLTSGAVGLDGRILVTASSASRWLFSTGLVDAHKGTITRVPLTFDAELASPVWTPDGKIVAVGRDYNYTMWKFHGSVK